MSGLKIRRSTIVDASPKAEHWSCNQIEWDRLEQFIASRGLNISPEQYIERQRAKAQKTGLCCTLQDGVLRRI